jgi:hypothetical protein
MNADLYAVWEQYKTDNPTNREFSFTQVLSQFFSATESRNCQDVNDEVCSQPVNCGQWTEANAAVNSPAGYLIMNQFAALHRAFGRFDRGVMNAFNIFTAGSSDLVKNFGSFTDVTKYLIEQDIMNLMFGFLGVGLWGRTIPLGAWSTSFVQDGARALIQFGVDYNKAQPSVAAHLDFNEGIRVWVTKVSKLLW